MPSSTPLNIPDLEKKYKKNNSMTVIILVLITITLAVIAVIGFILIQRSSV
jgi:flagellar basal body-associated protein FliL